MQRYIKNTSDALKEVNKEADLRMGKRHLQRDRAIEGLLLRIKPQELKDIMSRELSSKGEKPQTLF